MAPKHKVVVTDYSFGELEAEQAMLEPLGCTIEGAQCRTEQQVAAVVADADYVITQFAPVSALAIAAMTRAKLIVRYGIGVDNVDLAAAAALGIPVFNVPDYCIDEVADHTLALILALTRQIVPLSENIRTGHWVGRPLENFRALTDMTTGIVGAGRIGRAVIRRLVGFQTRMLAYDPLLREEDARAMGVESVPLERIWTESDLITLHVPSTADTRRLINAESLARMKDGVLVINVSRGTIVDTEALVAALQSGKVGGAALDVTDPEPIPTDSLLPTLDNVIITPHVASASVRAAKTLRFKVADTVARSIRGETMPPSVNGVPA